MSKYYVPAAILLAWRVKDAVFYDGLADGLRKDNFALLFRNLGLQNVGVCTVFVYHPE